MKDLTLEKILADKENLERILDNLMEGIIAHDTKRRIQYFNREAERITGYPREEVLGRDCHSVFGAPFCGNRCSFCDGPPDAWQDLDYPLNITAKNGETRRIEMRVTGMRDKSGTFAGIIAAIRDVTDLLELQIELGRLTGFAGIVGQDHKMLRIFKQIRDLAATDYPIHIMGETGTGKELVAAAIHNEGRRRGKPFVPINCGALPEGVLESELFGHVRGAFTGAIRDKKGRFELADGGTIFLDEVTDLPKPVQVKLLRVLQEGTFERLGGEETVSVNVRSHQRRKQGSQTGGGAEAFQGRPLLPDQCGPTSIAPPSGKKERHPAPCPAFSDTGRGRRSEIQGHIPGGPPCHA